MPTCVPISDTKDTVAFSRKVSAAGEPVIVTKNGYEQYVAIDAELFRSYRRETPEEHLERLLAEADRDVDAGNVSGALEGLADKIDQTVMGPVLPHLLAMGHN